MMSFPNLIICGSDGKKESDTYFTKIYSKTLPAPIRETSAMAMKLRLPAVGQGGVEGNGKEGSRRRRN